MFARAVAYCLDTSLSVSCVEKTVEQVGPQVRRDNYLELEKFPRRGGFKILNIEIRWKMVLPRHKYAPENTAEGVSWYLDIATAPDEYRTEPDNIFFAALMVDQSQRYPEPMVQWVE